MFAPSFRLLILIGTVILVLVLVFPGLSTANLTVEGVHLHPPLSHLQHPSQIQQIHMLIPIQCLKDQSPHVTRT